jgi:hypothetical protein
MNAKWSNLVFSERTGYAIGTIDALVLGWLVVIMAIALLLARALGLWPGFLVRERVPSKG